MFDEIRQCDKAVDNENKLYILTKVADKYLCVSEDNIIYLQGGNNLIQAFIKACTHQIWQRLYFIYHNKHMTIDDIMSALALYTDVIGQCIAEARNITAS
jgi:hypothetical protein